MEEDKVSIKKTWRYEYKMVIGNSILEEVRTKILLHPKSFFERYPIRKVNNIYFDTNDMSNYYDALSGCTNRSKLRFRWYGESLTRAKGFLELKEKRGMLISKTLQEINSEINLTELTWGELVSIIKMNIKDSLALEFSYACVPVIINSYYRYYYETVDGSCRVTLDYDIKVFDQKPYNKPNCFFLSPQVNQFILEIKADEKEELNIEKITNFFPFRVTQNSKYTSGITI